MKETHVQRNYKDTMFRMLFKEKENLLSLYNAVNRTSYTDVGELLIKGVCAVCGTGKKLYKEAAISGSGGGGSGLLHQEWDTGRFSVKESCGGDSSEYI